ncbi:MAG: HU family DNA-binding protein [Chthoniobacteraceae bacterium]
MATLTKRDLVVKISNETGMVQHQVFDVIQRTLDHITSSLGAGDTVELRNFGVFEVRLTKPRVGRNPNQPGSQFKIPERATVKFKSGKMMKQKVGKLSAALSGPRNSGLLVPGRQGISSGCAAVGFWRRSHDRTRLRFSIFCRRMQFRARAATRG